MQMDRLRKSNEIILSTPRVGYFTTMPFLATWQTNVSNQARVTMNEAMIVGLNQAFDGTNGTMAGVLPGLDSTHGNPSSPCFSCHRNLDPMRMFYLHELTNFWSPQTDETMAAVPPTFAFNSAPVTGSSLYDLGDQIAANPGFAAAWTQKLCMWANSRPCVPTDPEFVRVAEAFKASSYNWSVLVKTLMTSPLITYQADSPTADSTGGLISLSRRDHLCRTLNARLNMDDLCAQSGQIGATTGSPLTTALPADGVIRGAVYASAPTATTMNYRTMVENLCINAANRAIDGQLVPDLGNQDPNVALHFLATGLMGLSASEAATPTQILTQHYTDALAAASADPNGSDAAQTIAIKSAFVLACTSPFVTAIGF
jgi:hypothetical protein